MPQNYFRSKNIWRKCVLERMPRWLDDLLPHLSELDDLVTALIRGDERQPAPSRRTRLQADDILVLPADPADLNSFINFFFNYYWLR